MGDDLNGLDVRMTERFLEPVLAVIPKVTLPHLQAQARRTFGMAIPIVEVTYVISNPPSLFCAIILKAPVVEGAWAICVCP